MARRNRFRSRGGQPGVFSLADMRDVLTSANDSLVDAIAAQNPNIDADGFETELRELVSRYGRGTAGAGVVPGFPTMASAVPQTRYEYNLAGDLLVAASEYFKQANYNAFFQSVRDAFRSDDASKLFAAASARALLWALRCSPGSIPSASSRRASSRRSRASLRPTSG